MKTFIALLAALLVRDVLKAIFTKDYSDHRYIWNRIKLFKIDTYNWDEHPFLVSSRYKTIKTIWIWLYYPKVSGRIRGWRFKLSESEWKEKAGRAY